MTASTERLPDFFVIGHPKSGTTALYEMLRRHPQVYMPDLKEPRYFAGDMYSPMDAPRGAGLPRTLAQYQALFAGAQPGQLAGEASPLYLSSHLAAGEIAAHVPDARLIAVLREPTSFLRSLHMQFVQSHIETNNDLRTAISLEDARREGKDIPDSSQFRPHVLFYSDHVRYVEQLERYQAVFPAEQLLVLIYEDFRNDNEAAVRRVLRFLELDHTVAVDGLEANPTVRVRSQQLDELMHAVSVGTGPLSRMAKASVKALAPRRLRRGALRAMQRRVIYGKPEQPDEQLTLELRLRFKPEIVKLSEYLNRDLVTLWGYDRTV
jgi:hypothetical protein